MRSAFPTPIGNAMLLTGAMVTKNQAIAHRGLVETIPGAEPLVQQPDPAPYVGTYARPNNSYFVRADGGKLIISLGGMEEQELVMFTRRGAEMVRESILPVRFVPLLGMHGWREGSGGTE